MWGQGQLSTSFDAQPVAHWRRLPPLKPDGIESPGIATEAARQGHSSISSDSERRDYMPHTRDTATESEADEGTSSSTVSVQNSQAGWNPAKGRSTADRAVSAGFVQTASGLCCCVALAKPGSGQHDMACLKTLVQPVWPEIGAASASWQETVLPIVSQEGEPPAEGVLLLCRASVSAILPA